MHVNIDKNDSKGNGTIGRFFIVPGSRERVKKIADNYLENIIVKYSKRGHDVYLGKIKGSGIDVGVTSTGMGCPSVDIIITELIDAGVKLFIRIGTCGSINDKCNKGSIIIANGCVRDESTSNNYAPTGFPAIGNRELINYLDTSCQSLDISHKVGIIHTKDSLYVREFDRGPLSKGSSEYMNYLNKLGVLASEMESSHFYILGSVYDVKCATICAVIGNKDDPFGLSDKEKNDFEDKTILVTLDAIKNYINNLLKIN